MGKVLVAFFSVNGVTERVAGKLAAAAAADLYEIVPEVPYTQEDLDWENKESRTTVEMADRNCRPSIGPALPDMTEYDTVYVGFPLWWYREPSIIDTFMENADLAGKTVVPFCTSGADDLGDSADNMQALAPDAKVLPGKRFKAGVTANELRQWVNGLAE
ncbi:MAG: flavodoxin [Lachnospiraceae bacterium]|nr:flavodoxin [Lachnospiraceae bacterium]